MQLLVARSGTGICFTRREAMIDLPCSRDETRAIFKGGTVSLKFLEMPKKDVDDRLNFFGIPIHARADGEATELHIALKVWSYMPSSRNTKKEPS